MVFSLFIALLSANVMEKVHAEVGIAAINESGDNIRLDIYSIKVCPNHV